MIQVVEKLEPRIEQEVSAFLARMPEEAGACQELDPRWLHVLREAMGHKPAMVIARKGKTLDAPIGGYLPVAKVASPLFGRFVVSLPYLNRAGIVAEDASIGAELIEAATDLAAGFRAKYLELRHGKPIEDARLGSQRADKMRMVLNLPASEEALLKAVGPKVRNLIKKGDKHNLSIRWGGRDGACLTPLPLREGPGEGREISDVAAPNTAAAPPSPGPSLEGRGVLRANDEASTSSNAAAQPSPGPSLEGRGVLKDVLNDFYNVFAVNMRDLGTPVYSRKLFGAIVDQFAGEAELCVVDFEGQPVAGALLVHDPLRKMTQVPSASALRDFNHTSANMWMYFHLLLRAMARGSERFDFGRSSEGSGTYNFKKQWGAQPQPTVWQYHVREGDIGSMRPDNPKYKRRIAMWQKLPVWLTRLVGPAIVRGIP